jgi:hypothetical protein
LFINSIYSNTLVLPGYTFLGLSREPHATLDNMKLSGAEYTGFTLAIRIIYDDINNMEIKIERIFPFIFNHPNIICNHFYWVYVLL